MCVGRCRAILTKYLRSQIQVQPHWDAQCCKHRQRPRRLYVLTRDYCNACCNAAATPSSRPACLTTNFASLCVTPPVDLQCAAARPSGEKLWACVLACTKQHRTATSPAWLQLLSLPLALSPAGAYVCAYTPLRLSLSLYRVHAPPHPSPRELNIDRS
jgi:hypothetical protein